MKIVSAIISIRVLIVLAVSTISMEKNSDMSRPEEVPKIPMTAIIRLVSGHLNVSVLFLPAMLPLRHIPGEVLTDFISIFANHAPIVLGVYRSNTKKTASSTPPTPSKSMNLSVVVS